MCQPVACFLSDRTLPIDDIFVRHWPNVPADDPIGPVFTKTNKYVLTRGMTKFDWANSHKLGSIEELK